MGNRAVITTEDRDIGIYLHWNGGRDSINAFLAYCKMLGYRCPKQDCYGWAGLCQVISNFMGGGMSVGIDRYDCLDRDNYDNGVYIIKDWNVIGRVYHNDNSEQCGYDLSEFMKEIDKRMPHPVGDEKIDEWISEHRREYTYDVVDAAVDKDKKAEGHSDIILEEDGDWSVWYIGWIKGIDQAVITRRKILDEYEIGVCVRSKRTDEEIIKYLAEELI